MTRADKLAILYDPETYRDVSLPGPISPEAMRQLMECHEALSRLPIASVAWSSRPNPITPADSIQRDNVSHDAKKDDEMSSIINRAAERPPVVTGHDQASDLINQINSIISDTVDAARSNADRLTGEGDEASARLADAQPVPSPRFGGSIGRTLIMLEGVKEMALAGLRETRRLDNA